MFTFIFSQQKLNKLAFVLKQCLYYLLKLAKDHSEADCVQQHRQSRMSFFKLFSGGERVKKKPCQTEEVEKLMEREELLVDKKEDLKRKIDQELLFAKRNSRTNRRGEIMLQQVHLHHCSLI